MKTFKEFVAEMYDQPMPRASGVPKPKRTPESKAAAKRERDLPNSAKLQRTEKDIEHQKDLQKKALHNIKTGNTSSSTAKVGKSLEQMKAELAAQRIKTFGHEHPLGPAPTPKPRPAPAAPIKKTKRSTPAAPIKKSRQ
jgi:hypothetical protein